MNEPSKNINHGEINAGGSVFIGDNNDIKIQHILGNLQDYQNLEQEIVEAREFFDAIALDKQEIRLKLSGTLEAKKEKLENIKKAIEQAFEYISKLTISTDRLDEAKALFLEGDIPGALEILKDEAIQADYVALQTAKQSEEERHTRRMEEIAEKTKGIAEEWKMKAVLMATQYEDEDWFEKTKGYYEKALEVDRDVEHVFDYAYFLLDHNQHKEATFLYEEALQIYRTLAQIKPRKFLRHVAQTLNNLAVLHRTQNDMQQAQMKYDEALVIRRRLAKVNPKTFLSDVAQTLNNLAVLHHNKKELSYAQEKYEEALAIRRGLAKDNQGEFLPDVAQTLNNLAVLYSDKNELGYAEREYEEALQIRRSLASNNPQVFLTDVAMTLNNLAVLHSDKNELKQAQKEYTEALTILRNLAQSNPYTFLPYVAQILNNLAALHHDKNELDQAQWDYDEALKIRRDLAKINPQSFLKDLAQTLNNLAILHSDKNELEKAQMEYEEALSLYKSLTQTNPEIFLPDMANVQVNLARFYQEHKPDQKHSLELLREALRGALPFEKYLKFAQDIVKEAKEIIKNWGLDVYAFLKNIDEENFK